MVLHKPSPLKTNQLCRSSDNYHLFSFAQSHLLASKSSGERVKATGTGKGYYWKSLTGGLHSGGHWVMAVLAQTREQLHCSCPPVVTKQVYLDTALLSQSGEGAEKEP